MPPPYPFAFDFTGFEAANPTAPIPATVAEAALAHAIENKVEAAYRRGNLLEKRRTMMAAWGDYCDGASARVVRLAMA